MKGKDIKGKEYLEKELIANAHATRQAMLKRGITPEELPAQEDLKKVENRIIEEKKKLGNTKNRIFNQGRIGGHK